MLLTASASLVRLSNVAPFRDDEDMSKKAKKSSGDPRKRGQQGASFGIDGASVSLEMNQAFAQSARRACSECGATQDGPKQAVDAAREVVPLLGADAETWWCRDCAGAGFFEQELHFEGFGQ
jgi:hypothetical protein